MGLKETDYLDYTLLKKKGILKVPEIKSLDLKNDDGFVDVSSAMKEIAPEQPAYPSYETLPSSPSSSAIPNMDFLGALAGAGSAESSAPIQTYSPSSPSPSDSSDINSLKIKLDDFEYKIERLIERIAKIEESLANKQI